MYSRVTGNLLRTSSKFFKFAETKRLQTVHVHITKRVILRIPSSIYDLIGLLGPITIKAKILTQELWKNRYSWDEILPTDVVNQWTDVENDILHVIKELEISRYYLGEEVQDNEKKILHVFVDASQNAYGASVYISKGTISAFVMQRIVLHH